MALTTPLMELIGGCAVAGILYYGHFRILSGEATMGTFSAFLGTLYAMYMPVKKLSQANSIVQQAVSAAERSVELLDLPVAVVEKPGAVALPPFSNAIRYERASFTYDGEKQVLDGLDLEVPKGQIVAIVGSSGAGKTTLVNLLPRLFDLQGGRVTIDGHDIRDVTLGSLQVADRHGDPGDGSLRRFGGGQHRLRPARRHAMPPSKTRPGRPSPTISSWSCPKGYDTRIGEGGFSLSGGQRQRLAIARALLKDPPILILDEATSALDSESEYLVQQALFNLLKGRTTLVIAHRLSTILNANRIVVLDQGRVVEDGTHKDLLDRGGLYAQLAAIEFRASQPAT